MDFKGMSEDWPKLNWQLFADEFIFDPRTDFIAESIKKVHEEKAASEQDFKRQIDRFILRASDACLHALGL